MSKPSDDQDAMATFWRNNSGHCVSGLVATLAQGGGTMGQCAIGELCEKAAELCYPIEDYEEAANQAGWQFVKAFDPGCIDAKLDGEFPTTIYGNKGETPNDVAYRIQGLEPYQWEIFEHWIVDQWLAEKLAEKGERVDMDFEGLCVWGRTCTGQAVSMDSVICEIYDGSARLDC